ncbi:MAG: hypothetical protein EZS28_021472 [Streblomastix strix]|uniref:Uncharacterized protein n=1 Tax=Streblomastix strix TaxID=222440 RepID=A0A5J4VK95_9EUKA|nr:MAG: hypothetical protein EZS28_021472 [Streblomastix strix]
MAQYVSPGGTGSIDFATYLQECKIPRIFSDWTGYVFLIEGMFGQVEQLDSDGKFTHTIEFTPCDSCFKGRDDSIILFLARDLQNAQQLLEPIVTEKLSLTRVQIFIQPVSFNLDPTIHTMELRHYHIPNSSNTANPSEADKFNSLTYVAPPIQQQPVISSFIIPGQQPLQQQQRPLPNIPGQYHPPQAQVQQQNYQQYSPLVVPKQQITSITPGMGNFDDISTVRAPVKGVLPQGQIGAQQGRFGAQNQFSFPNQPQNPYQQQGYPPQY